MNLLQRCTLGACVALGLPACTDAPSPSGPEHAGRLEVSVAPLSLPGVAFACFDLKVEGASGSTVWSAGDPALTFHGQDQTATPVVAAGGAGDAATICSDTYGNGAGGDISYIGTCDATSDSNPTVAGVQNRVTVWVDGLYASASPVTSGRIPARAAARATSTAPRTPTAWRSST